MKKWLLRDSNYMVIGLIMGGIYRLGATGNTGFEVFPAEDMKVCIFADYCEYTVEF